jgi:hypothetical protein
VRLGEALLVHAQELLEVLFDHRNRGDSRARGGRYTRAQISTPPQLPAGETGANRERVPAVLQTYSGVLNRVTNGSCSASYFRTAP